MLTKADKLRAKFHIQDPVMFGKRKIYFGEITQLNRTTATVLIDEGTDEFMVPFELLEHYTPDPKPSDENKLSAVSELANQLIKTHQLKKWKFKFDHSSRRAGCCNYREKCISISFHLARNAADQDIRDTILHEIAHALVGRKHNHDAVWKTKAKEIGCSGERTHQLVFSPPRYHVSCENQCWKQTAERRNPRLICRTCGGKLVYVPYCAPS